MNANPITLELYRHRFAGIADEMGISLQRTAYSPNIKERLDFSCAIFDAQGRMVAQAAHIPVHQGAMPDSVAAALAAVEAWHEGDLVILNDPFAGGTHLPDITMVSPVFLANDGPHFFVASRAHHADVGGMTPGSLPLSTELYQEGLIIPPLKLYERGMLNEAVWRLILRNVRTPDERRGDLAAQRAAHLTGERRLHELAAVHGCEEVLAYARYLQVYSERRTRAAIRTCPDGCYTFEDVIEHVEDGNVQLLPIRVAITIAGDEMTFDFAGTAPQVRGSLNAVLSITKSACAYVVRCLVGDDVPMNAGCFAPLHLRVPEGTLVNARPPAAVAGGNVETSQRIVDVVLGALAHALPDRIPAASQGTMNNVTIGGTLPDGHAFAYYETLAGGMGAAPTADGLDAVHTHMTNTRNTPVEALERAYPFRVMRYAIRRGSGGRGRYRGGDGLIREYELLADATVTLLTERRVRAPWGLQGGQAGATGRTLLIQPDGREEVLPAKCSRHVRAGTRLRIETPGGGGWGQADDP